MSIRKFVLLVSLVTVGALLATTAIVYRDEWTAWMRPNAGPKADVDRFGDTATPYAYITEDRLTVVREGRVIVEVERLFDPGDAHANTHAWTHNGDYLAMFSDNALRTVEFPQELIVVDTRTGDVERTPCEGCTDITAIGEQTILVSDYKGLGSDGVVHLTGYDPADLDHPASIDAFGHADFLSSTRDHVLSYTTSWQGNTSGVDLQLANAGTGESMLAGWVGSNTYLKSAALAGDGDRSDQFAVAYTVNPGMCFSSYPIQILTSDGGHMETDTSAAEPPGFVPDVSGGGMRVEDLWWDLEGRLHASMSSWTCDTTAESQNHQRVLLESMRIWRLDGASWVPTDFPPASMMEQIDEDSYLRLQTRDCVGDRTITNYALQCNVGDLYLRRGATENLVAEGVIAVSTPSH